MPSLQSRSHFRNGLSSALRALFNGIRTSQKNRPFSFAIARETLQRGAGWPQPRERRPQGTMLRDQSHTRRSGGAAITSGMRFTMHAAEVCTPSARSTRMFDDGLPSTAHIKCSASPSARMRNSICALAVGPAAVSTDATILRPSEVPGSSNLFRMRHHTG